MPGRSRPRRAPRSSTPTGASIGPAKSSSGRSWPSAAAATSASSGPRGNAGASIWLEDINGQRVAEATGATNAFGTASGEFTIPAAGRPLGAWRLRTSPDGYAQVRVEEYKRPTFEVTVKDPEKPLRLNRPATLKGEARYYFGLPVASGASRLAGQARAGLSPMVVVGQAGRRKRPDRRRRQGPDPRGRDRRSDVHAARGRARRRPGIGPDLPLYALRRRHRRGRRNPVGEALLPPRLRQRGSRDRAANGFGRAGATARSPSRAPTSTARPRPERDRGASSVSSSPRRRSFRPTSPFPIRRNRRARGLPADSGRSPAAAMGTVPGPGEHPPPLEGRSRGRPGSGRARRRRPGEVVSVARGRSLSPDLRNEGRFRRGLP